MKSFQQFLTESYRSILADSLKEPHKMTWQEFSRPPAIPRASGGHMLFAHVTAAKNIDSILRSGLTIKHSSGRSMHEPVVVWATAYGDVWGGALAHDARLIVFDMPTSMARRSGSGIFQFLEDVPPTAFIAVERAGYSSVSTGALTVREERMLDDDEERKMFWEAYRYDAGITV